MIYRLADGRMNDPPLYSGLTEVADQVSDGESPDRTGFSSRK